MISLKYTHPVFAAKAWRRTVDLFVDVINMGNNEF